METELKFNPPIMVRTLSSHHWEYALDDMKSRNLDYIEAGNHSNEWFFYITKIDNHYYKEVWQNNFLIKREFY